MEGVGEAGVTISPVSALPPTTREFLFQEQSLPLSKASRQTQLLCTLVKDMLRSDSSQLSAEDAASHEFFSLALGPR